MRWARIYAVELSLLGVIALLWGARPSLLSAAENRSLSNSTLKEHAIRPDRLFLIRSVNPAVVADLFVEAIIQVESAGNPLKVGAAGERGLMQIKLDTWRHVTRRIYGKSQSFDLAFDPELNVRVGRAYLFELQQFLAQHRDKWKSDERALLLACYNVGPQRVRRAGFDVERLPASVRDYVQRATALHDFYLAEQAPLVRAILLADVAMGTDDPG